MSHNITMLGTGLIGMFYTMTLHGQRGRDRVQVIYSRSEERAQKFAQDWNIPHAVTDMKAAIEHPATDTVVIGLPNHLHGEAVRLAAAAGHALTQRTGQFQLRAGVVGELLLHESDELLLAIAGKVLRQRGDGAAEFVAVGLRLREQVIESPRGGFGGLDGADDGGEFSKETGIQGLLTEIGEPTRSL